MKKPFHLRSWLIGQLRRIYRRHPAFYETLNEGKIVTTIKSKKGKDLKRVFHTCKSCQGIFKSSDINVDHIEPVIPTSGFPVINGEDDWNTYIKRLFVDKSGLQKLCITCHASKSLSENSARRQVKKKKSKKTS